MQVPEVSKEMMLESGGGVRAALKSHSSLVLCQGTKSGLGKKNTAKRGLRRWSVGAFY